METGAYLHVDLSLYMPNAIFDSWLAVSSINIYQVKNEPQNEL